MKLTSAKTWLLTAVVVILLFMTTVMAVRYFSTPMVSFERLDYIMKEQSGDKRVYRTSHGYSEVIVTGEGDNRTVAVDGIVYKVTRMGEGERPHYRFEYPDGNVLKGGYEDDWSPRFVIEDEQGHVEEEPLFHVVTGDPPLQPEHPILASALARIAFEPVSQGRGTPFFYWIGLGMLPIAAICWRYPLLGFKLRYALWVENPEPTEFYIYMAKVGAVVTAVLGIAFMIRSLC